MTTIFNKACIKLGMGILLAINTSHAMQSQAQLPAPIDAVLAQHAINPHSLGAVITPIDGDMQPRILHQAHTHFVPASTQKLIATAAALDLLGADFVWRTPVYAQGVQVGQVLYGDLIIQGSGEPTVRSEELSALLERIHQKIAHITGDIIIDNHAFSQTQYDVYAFDGQGDKPYNAYPSAFLVNFGTVQVQWLPSAHKNATATVRLSPELAVIYPKTTPTKPGCQTPKIQNDWRTLRIVGAFGVDCGSRSVWVNMADNEKLAEQAIATKWRQLDRHFTGKVYTVNHAPKTPLLPILVHTGDPLSTQIRHINQFSNNVMTEQLALSLPLYAQNYTTSTYPLTFALLKQWFMSKISPKAPVMTRASGLCTDCVITPSAMHALLLFMAKHPDFAVFLDSLPVAGQSGTMLDLKRRNPQHPAIGKAWVKTGTLNNVKALAGYVQNEKGQWYILVAMLNYEGAGYDGRATAVLDALLAWTVQAT